jgi:hypothetical protein
MNAVCYPLPLENWHDFRANVIQFCDSWRAHPPGADCTLFAMCCRYEADSEVREIFRELPVEFSRYDGGGFDIGAHQHCALEIGDAFQIGVSSRTFFHREGWLKKVLEVREYFGPGLFATAVSLETGVQHFRTYFYGMETAEWRQYPHLIGSKETTFAFEHAAYGRQDMCILNWAKGRPHMAIAAVNWDGGWRETEWFFRPNIFRLGDQSNLLAFDRHTELWRAASAEAKEYGRRVAFGISEPPPPEKKTDVADDELPQPISRGSVDS